jgi:fimbrial chaperone protein
MRARTLLSTLSAATLCLGAGSAGAGGLQVNPVQVELTRSHTNAIVALRNDTDEAVRYQVNAVTWDQDAAGQMKLGPTHDLILFPLIISLNPGEQRNLRVGVQPDKFGDVEKTYRVFVEQMPPAEKPGGKPAVKVLMRVGIPVYLEPPTPVASSRIEKAGVSRGALSFRLQNAGNVRVRPTEITAQALGADGKPVAQQTWNGWYVLAGGDRAYDWTLPAEACPKARSVKIEARYETGPAVSATVQVKEDGCKP